MSEVAKSVLYATRQGKSFPVRQLAGPEQVTAEDAQTTLSLLAKAYQRQFEEPSGPIPRGTFTRHFFPSADGAENVARYQDHMRTRVSQGSRYWVTWPNDEPLGTGVVMVSPSRANALQKARLQAPNCYVNDAVVDPDDQGRAIGSALLHAALSYSGFNPERDVAFDVFDANPRLHHAAVQLGVSAVDAKIPPYSVAGGRHELPMTRYSSEGMWHATIGSVARAALNAAHLTELYFDRVRD